MTNKPTLQVIHGSSQNRGTANTLRQLLTRSDLTGTLLIGYPPGVDAVLVSAKGQTTAIDLPPAAPGDYQDRQDRAFVHIDRLLRLNPALTFGRKPLIRVQTVTMTQTAIKSDLDNPKHPLATPDTIALLLRYFQEILAPEGLDHDTVLNQVMWTPPAL